MITITLIFVVLLVVTIASPAHAFGAGYVAKGSTVQGTAYRHADILNAVYFLTGAHSSLIRQIYFGNWLRDFSQLIDRKSIEVVPEPILRAIVAIFAHAQFGYTTKEFEVTSERLGSYRPEEHIDNPRGYEPGAHSQLRLQVQPQELEIDDKSGMKNYISNQNVAKVNETSRDYIEKQLVAAISCGRSRDAEAYTHLGAALHTLEDFVAHSNWVELCLQILGGEAAIQEEGVRSGLKNVFTFTGDAAKIKTHRGSASPLITGTFGPLDLYQTLLGEIEDKISATSLPGLRMRMKDPTQSITDVSKTLIGIFNKFDDNNFESDITSVTKSATDKPADWGRLNEAPDLLWDQVKPIFRLRDKIVRWVHDHLTINAVANAIAAISTALDKLVYLILGVFLSPVLEDITKALHYQSERLLARDRQVRLAQGEDGIFDPSSRATDPTHSQLCKDHYDHDLNELAGRVASKITTFTIKKVIEVWQPGSRVDVKPTLTSILETLHHPYNSSSTSEIQALMMAEVLNWCTQKQQENHKDFVALLQRLDKPHMAAKLGEELDQIPHSHARSGPGAAHDEANTVDRKPAPSPLASKIENNLSQQMQKVGIKGFSPDDLPIIRDWMAANPSSDAPNPIDYTLTKLPGMNVLMIFEGIDGNEIMAAEGMGVILKDAVISMRLQDEEWVERQQLAAQQRLGALEDRPIKEMLRMLDIEPEERTFERPTEESKTRRLIGKMKISNITDGYQNTLE